MSDSSPSSDRSAGIDGAARRARRRPGENRERLIEAGISVFGSHGYHGASTTAIAALADVPQPHVYASFQTKQDLFLACARRVVEDLMRASTTGGSSPTDQSSQTAFLLQCIAAFQEQNLQPELSERLQELCDVLGTDELISLISRHVRGTLADL